MEERKKERKRSLQIFVGMKRLISSEELRRELGEKRRGGSLETQSAQQSKFLLNFWLFKKCLLSFGFLARYNVGGRG